jgi:hypothetical protein
MRSLPTGWADIDLSTQTTKLHLRYEPPHDHVVHPFLGSTAVVVAHWRGMQSFHAGAFVSARGAWAILGDKGAGKSSMLAALSLEGASVLTDDILVIDEHLHGLAGPRCIDLRRETASALDLGISLGIVGSRERWRLQLDPVAPSIPLVGWICLDWGEPEISTVAAHERISLLYENIGLRVEQRDPRVLARLLDLLALPTLRIVRRKDVSKLAETAATVLDYVETVHLGS